MGRVGIDIGGTKIEAALLDDEFRVERAERAPTPRDYAGLVAAAARLARGLGGGRLPVGACAPGAVQPGTGLVSRSNVRCLEGMPLGRDLGEAIGADVTLENDAACFALAEARLGAGRGFGTVFGATLGTGVGGGVVSGGRLLRGRSGLAGEWGHHVLRPGGRPCHCGRSGCVETCISGPALERSWRLITGGGGPLSGVPAAISGGPALLWKERLLADLGEALANVVAVLDPDAIVLGGGVSGLGFLHSEGAAALHARAPGGARTPVLRGELGAAGAVGACLV